MAITGSLTRYRVMAIVTSVSLLLLVFVMMPIRYIGDNPRPSELFSPFHGLMFMLYVITVLDLFTRARWGYRAMVLVMLAGCVPFVSFIAERRTTAKARALLAET